MKLEQTYQWTGHEVRDLLHTIGTKITIQQVKHLTKEEKALIAYLYNKFG